MRRQHLRSLPLRPPPQVRRLFRGSRPSGSNGRHRCPPAQPAYVAPQPDLSFQYPVLLGGLPQDRAGDGFDAPATEKADVGNDMVAEFRKHLKTCSKLPEDIAPSDQVAIKMQGGHDPRGPLGR